MSTGEKQNLRVAIVHDELTRRGGAESVLVDLIRLWPEAQVYTLYAGQPQITVDERTYPVETTFVQKLPVWFRRKLSRVAWLLPIAAEQIDLSEFDLVISSASGFSKSVVTRAQVPHICYCHTPTRYLWESRLRALERMPTVMRMPAKIVQHWLRLQDFAAGQRVDYFIANSNWTRARIAKYYRREAEIVYPKVDTNYFTPSANRRQGFALCVGRLTPEKYFDQAIAVCEKLEIELRIVGKGMELGQLRKMAGKNTRFLGNVSREDLRNLYREAKVLLQPGVEDFGIASAEAQACGLPVVAFNQGGVREIVRHAETGWLYDPGTVEGLAEGLREFFEREDDFSHELMQKQALKFSGERWKQAMVGIVKSVKKG